VLTYEYVWAIATIIFSYTGSPEVKISQKVLGGGLLFWLTLYIMLARNASSFSYCDCCWKCY